jgi:hypothetical protein
MGLRIRKLLGYALTDVKTKNGDLADPRINPEGILGEGKDAEDWTEEGYFQFAKRKFGYESGEFAKADYCHLIGETIDGYDAFMLLGETEPPHSRKPLSFYNAVTYNGEYGRKNILLVTPITHPEWQRYDDVIDYYNEPKVGARYREIRGGLYPYNGFYINRFTKEHVKHAPSIYRALWSGKLKDEEENVLMKFAGFENVKEFKKTIVPDIPDCIRLTCEYTNLFVNLDVVYDLKPILYTFWA